MKISVKAATDDTLIKVVYCEGMDTQEPLLRKMTVKGKDLKETLMAVADNYLALPYLGLDFNEPDTFTVDELIDRIVYCNGTEVDMDYIFLLEINGDPILDNTGSEENYTVGE